MYNWLSPESDRREIPNQRNKEEDYDSDQEDDGIAIGEPRAIPHRRNNRHEDFGSQDFQIKIDILIFHGRLNLEEFLDWIQTMDSFFEYMDVPEKKQVTLV